MARRAITPVDEEHVEEVVEIPFSMKTCSGSKKVYRFLRELDTRVDWIEVSLATLSSQYGKMAADIKTLQTQVDKRMARNAFQDKVEMHRIVMADLISNCYDKYGAK